ncbi:MAG: 30S ribosomal protein S3 [Chloroflexi bacterium]|nr:30S ribosomal protein S3 [Chloroflexota bacterium]
MGHKVHPLGFRLGVIRDWQSRWYADRHFAEFLEEDLKLRKAISERYAEAAISAVDIERQTNQVTVTIRTARPGIVIGRGGQRVDEARRSMERLIGKRVQLNIQEVQQPETDATLVAKSIAEQLERRIAYRRAMKQAVVRAIQAGAKGARVNCAGRLGGAEIARRLNMHEGRVPLHTLRADIDYGFTEARTVMGRIGVKVWIYKGDILPQAKVAAQAAEAVAQPAAAPIVEATPVAEAVASAVAEAAVVTAPAPEAAPETVPASETEAQPVEEKPAPVRRRRTRAAAASEAPVAPAAGDEAAPPAAEEKPAPVRRRRTRAAAAPSETPAAETETLPTSGEKNAST